ncbi:MAG: hypothetical protein QOI13_684, partial [Paraburkholderia sp.]|nr:hypothetical protein [Paraburkholderia sp.]
MIENQSAKGKGYDNPKHWGDDAEKGDIFQITEAESDANTVSGDFYIAQEDAQSEGYASYPHFGVNNGSWVHAWSKCVTPALVTPSFGTAATLYANGRHCAEIDFWFNPADANGAAITNLPSGYFREVLKKFGGKYQLIRANGEPLPQGWATLTVATPYIAVIEGSQPAGDTPQGTSCLTLYVSTTQQTIVSLCIQLEAADGTVLTVTSDNVQPVIVTGLRPLVYFMRDCSLSEGTFKSVGDMGYSADGKNQYFYPSDENFGFCGSAEISGGLSRDAFSKT